MNDKPRIMRHIRSMQRIPRVKQRFHPLSFVAGICCSFILFLLSPSHSSTPSQTPSNSPTPPPASAYTDVIAPVPAPTAAPVNYSVEVGGELFDDLLAFTGLNHTELSRRLEHSLDEDVHRFHEAYSPREAAFFRQHSASRLWEGALRPPANLSALGLSSATGPVLDYCGGAASNCLVLARLGIQCIYSGTSSLDVQFAAFRVARRAPESMVHVVKDGVLNVGDVLKSPLGSVLYWDSLTNDPDHVAYVMSLLRPGGEFLLSLSADVDPLGDGLQITLEGMSHKGRVLGTDFVRWVKDDEHATQDTEDTARQVVDNSSDESTENEDAHQDAHVVPSIHNGEYHPPADSNHELEESHS